MNAIFRGKILTIPNLISFFRLCLIPLFLWTYIARENSLLTGLILILSGITDTLDGVIARRFNMVSDFGKALDPLADKLTQIAMLACLSYRFPYILIPFAALCVKELFVLTTSLMVIHKTGEVEGAMWHGKMATASLYITMIVHLLFPRLPSGLSVGSTALCTALILLSGVLYGIKNIKLLQQTEATKNA